jgi:hypothetical protein
MAFFNLQFEKQNLLHFLFKYLRKWGKKESQFPTERIFSTELLKTISAQKEKIH